MLATEKKNNGEEQRIMLPAVQQPIKQCKKTKRCSYLSWVDGPQFDKDYAMMLAGVKRDMASFEKDGQGGDPTAADVRLQGDLEQYTKEAMHKRRNIKKQAVIQEWIEVFWDILELQVDKDGKELLHRDTYIALMLRVQFALDPDCGDVDATRRTLMRAEEDWTRDYTRELERRNSAGVVSGLLPKTTAAEKEAGLSFASFFDSLFELADTWCSTTDLREYCCFFAALLDVVCVPVPSRRAAGFDPAVKHMQDSQGHFIPTPGQKNRLAPVSRVCQFPGAAARAATKLRKLSSWGKGEQPRAAKMGLKYVIAEVAQFVRPPRGVHRIMHAALVLLGHKSSDCLAWDDLTATIRSLRMTDNLLKRTIAGSNRPSASRCREAQRILSGVRPDVDKTCKAIASVHAWCNDVLRVNAPALLAPDPMESREEEGTTTTTSHGNALPAGARHLLNRAESHDPVSLPGLSGRLRRAKSTPAHGGGKRFTQFSSKTILAMLREARDARKRVAKRNGIYAYVGSVPSARDAGLEVAAKTRQHHQHLMAAVAAGWTIKEIKKPRTSLPTTLRGAYRQTLARTSLAQTSSAPSCVSADAA